METLVDRLLLIKCGALSSACCVSPETYVAIGQRGRILSDAQLALEHHAICCAAAASPVAALSPDQCARDLVAAMCHRDHMAYVIAADEALKTGLAWGGAFLPRPILSGLLVLSLGLSAWSVACTGDDFSEDGFRAVCLANAELTGWMADLSETLRAALKPVADLFGMEEVRSLLDRCCTPASLTAADELLTRLPKPAWWDGEEMAPTLQAIGLRSA